MKLREQFAWHEDAQDNLVQYSQTVWIKRYPFNEAYMEASEDFCLTGAI